MSNQTVISIESLGKAYRINHQVERRRYNTLRDVVANKFKRLLSTGRPNPDKSSSREDFWALRNVDFDVKQGEVLGIVGRNGAGKSTLLKILSRITEPSEGRARIKGRIASLLEVGTGFHPELTGRENIFLNGAVLGMSRTEIKSKFDEIVSFAEVQKFLDTAVKFYSSGMYVRLAFAVAAHLEPEILIVDEVLAVGDGEFQKKCLGKMKSVARGDGRTILFVSHNIPAIRSLCSRAILLKCGELVANNTVDNVLESYVSATAVGSTWQRPDSPWPTPTIRYQTIRALISGVQPALQLVVDAEIVCDEERPPQTFVSIDLCDALGAPLMQAIPVGQPFLDLLDGSNYIQLIVDLPGLTPGQYQLDFWIGKHYTSTLDYIRQAISISIDASPMPNRTFPHSSDHGFLIAPSRCEVKTLSR